jgi:hypothetical protein
MSNLLEKNIFYQISKDKSNPDILVKKNSVDQERKLNIFKANQNVYNSITNQTISNIKSSKDLQLQKDCPISNIEELLNQKKKERETEEIINKNQQNKVVINNIQDQTYTELKSNQNEFLKLQKKEILLNKNKYEDIMDNLKNLGIINK